MVSHSHNKHAYRECLAKPLTNASKLTQTALIVMKTSQITPGARTLSVSGLHSKAKSYPANHSRTKFTEILQVQHADSRIELMTHEEVVEEITCFGKNHKQYGFHTLPSQF